MRTATIFFAAIVFSLVTQSTAAPSPTESAATIEQCAKLLPQGKHYTFEVNGSIDYSGATPVVHGELSLTDGTNHDLTQEAGPFAECFARIVR